MRQAPTDSGGTVGDFHPVPQAAKGLPRPSTGVPMGILLCETKAVYHILFKKATAPPFLVVLRLSKNSGILASQNSRVETREKSPIIFAKNRAFWQKYLSERKRASEASAMQRSVKKRVEEASAFSTR